MKGLVELKDSEGEVRLSCLFGMTAILNFCRDKKISFNDLEKELTDSTDLTKQFGNIISLFYYGVKSFNTFQKNQLEVTEEEVSLILDAYGLLNAENMSKFQGALFGGFENVEEKKTQAEVKA